MTIVLPLSPRVVSEEKNKAVFEIERLYPGYGQTIGNSLRRFLLSSLEGAAVTSVKIKSVDHEFTTLPGVLEDIVDITLNLKQVRVRMFADESQTAEIKVKGEREVKAGDIKVPSQLEIVNPQLHIVTITDSKASFEAELKIEKGLGYIPVSADRKTKVEVGTIALDAIYSPVRKVSYDVENMRVGERTDFNRLRLFVETDGTITPQEAFRKSAEILTDHFRVLTEGISPQVATVINTDGAAVTELSAVLPDGELMQKGVEELGLSGRTVKALKSGNVRTLRGLLRKSESSLLELEGMGEKGVEEIRSSLKQLGYDLKKE